MVVANEVVQEESVEVVHQFLPLDVSVVFQVEVEVVLVDLVAVNDYSNNFHNTNILHAFQYCLQSFQ